jgi:hypothetical protein
MSFGQLNENPQFRLTGRCQNSYGVVKIIAPMISIERITAPPSMMNRE